VNHWAPSVSIENIGELDPWQLDSIYDLAHSSKKAMGSS